MEDITAEGLLHLDIKMKEYKTAIRVDMYNGQNDMIEASYLTNYHNFVLVKLLTFQVLTAGELGDIRRTADRILDSLEEENIASTRIDAILATVKLRMDEYVRICKRYELWEIMANINNFNNL